MQPIRIGRKLTGSGQPCYVIAEAGVNHNGDIRLARKMIEAAATSGADAIKFQTFSAVRLVTPQAVKADYQIRNTGADETQYQMLAKLELSSDAHAELRMLCLQLGIEFLSSPFDEESADMLAQLGVAAYKIPSGELTNLPYLRHIAQKGKPLIVSTGMATIDEVDEAVRTIQGSGNRQIILLQCVSNYPADPADINLRVMGTLAGRFQVATGYSDHTDGVEISLAAAALGACVIEKHFTLDRSLPGPDHIASLEPAELKAMVGAIRRIEKAMGNGIKQPAASEANTAQAARKSLVAARNLEAGAVIEPDMIRIMRPGSGLPPKRLSELVGRVLAQRVDQGTLLSFEMLR